MIRYEMGTSLDHNSLVGDAGARAYAAPVRSCWPETRDRGGEGVAM